MTGEEYIALRERRGARVVRNRDGDWHVTCPAHADGRPSLHVSERDDRWLLHCHANCAGEAVLVCDGLTLADTFHEPRRNGAGKLEIVATYPYVDEDGTLLYEVVRLAPKAFRQRRPDGNGDWIWKLDRTRRVLFRLQQVIAAIKDGTTVYLVEGEEDVLALERAGQVATTNPGGAGKWRKDYTDTLRGANVVMVADRDPAGYKHVATVAEQLGSAARSFIAVEGVEGKDARDHLAAGHTVEQFRPIDAASGQATPTAPTIPTAELLDAVDVFTRQFMVLPSQQVADLLALWTLHTWSLEAAFATPYLRIVSAAPESGKTLLMEILAAICRTGWLAVNPSPAVLYRKIERDTPTLMLDEMDNFPLDERTDVLAVLNAGYKRGAKVPRFNPQRNELEEFSCFCAKAYAGLDRKALAPALLSRSITVRLDRKARNEHVERWLGHRVAGPAEQLRAMCSAWAHQCLETLRDAEPVLPDSLGARACEVWWALLAIAEEAGGDWPQRARAAAVELSAGGDVVDGVVREEQLLADIRDAFGNGDAILTKELLAKLNGDDERPWGGYRKGNGLDGRGLARMLRPFGVRPGTIGSGAESAKGYRSDQFADAFARYLCDASQASQASHASPHGKRDATDATDATRREGPRQQVLDVDAAGNGHAHVEQDDVAAYVARQRQREADGAWRPDQEGAS
jgi:hypothetical protein